VVTIGVFASLPDTSAPLILFSLPQALTSIWNMEKTELHLSIFDYCHREIRHPDLTGNSLTRFYMALGKTLSELRLEPTLAEPQRDQHR
jgi:hypothetical protein